MTMNLSKVAMAENREFVVVERDPQRARVVQGIFDADWSYGEIDAAHLGSFVLSPINSRSQITKLIESAKRTVAIQIEIFFDPAIFDLLAKKQKQGVAVSVLLPSPKKIDFGLQTVAELRRRGITNIRFIKKPNPHCKLIIADNQQAYIGSINLSTNSMDNNRELGVILDDASIVSQLIQINMADWSKGEAFPVGTLAKAAARPPARLPISFDIGL
jgi:hypothetical protein